MENGIFRFSENAKSEYCATVVQIGELKPIEGSDFLAQTLVEGFSIVVRKDEFKTGDYAIYAQNETMLNKDFLRVNNMFDISERDLNDNAAEVNRLMEEGKTDEAKSKVGFFNKHGRVKMLRLRGCPSMGCLFHLETLAKWEPLLKDVDLSEYVGTDFDEVNGVRFISVYVPPLRPHREHSSGGGKMRDRNKKLAKFDRMIPGEFSFHYDTQQLQRSISRVKPDDKVVISVKLHGTSFISGNVLVKKPSTLTVGQRIKNRHIAKEIKRLSRRNGRNGYVSAAKRREMKKSLLSRLHRKYTVGYGNVYSSRNVIRNQYINKNVGEGFYGTDIYGEYNSIIKPYVEEGMTVYGEICGYLTGSSTMIQKEYDYGCAEGENFLMLYRITTTEENGRKREWTVGEVYEWAKRLLKENPDLKKRIHPIDILYQGTLSELYPDVVVDEHWHDNILECLKNETERFGMEENEPMCKKKVPREGICLRIDDDPVTEAFKLKCIKYDEREKKKMDKGEVDMEMAEAYGSKEEEK